jgi:serine-type D-Ala-D-Ala carboxypeptidase (penicillin-binding protein 5/6)
MRLNSRGRFLAWGLTILAGLAVTAALVVPSHAGAAAPLGQSALIPPQPAVSSARHAVSSARPAVSAPRHAVSAPPVDVLGGELVDLSTGTVMWSQDANVPRPMGSITKVMTALLVLRAGDLNREITVTDAAVAYAQKDGASSAGLIAGDVLTAQQLLEAMLLPSGCDAAYLLANAYGPGLPAFIAKMNAMAKALDMTSTHFSWFDGMPYPTEYSTYSTPTDLLRLGVAAMRNADFRSIVGQYSYSLPATALHHSYLWYTTNGLIGSYRGAVGIKTGDTIAAGNCLLFGAVRDRGTLIGVVLHARPSSDPNSAITAGAQVLNWGYAQL